MKSFQFEAFFHLCYSFISIFQRNNKVEKSGKSLIKFYFQVSFIWFGQNWIEKIERETKWSENASFVPKKNRSWLPKWNTKLSMGPVIYLFFIFCFLLLSSFKNNKDKRRLQIEIVSEVSGFNWKKKKKLTLNLKYSISQVKWCWF